MALASIDAIKGRNKAISEGASAGGIQARRQNLGYQAFDVGQGLASGLPLPLILAQQGPQIAQLYAGQGGLKAAASDARAALGGIVSLAATTVAAIGPIGLAFGGVAAAAGAFYLLTRTETKTTDEVLQEHAENIKALGDAYGISEQKLKKFSEADKTIAAAAARKSTEELQASKKQEIDDFSLQFGQIGGFRGAAPTFGMKGGYTEFLDAFRKLRTDGDLETFVASVKELGKNEAFKTQADKILGMAEKLGLVNDKLQETARLQKLIQAQEAGQRGYLINSPGEDARNDFDDARQLSLYRQQQDYERSIAALNARSPSELAEAARRRVRETAPAGESPDVTEQRAINEGKLAQQQAEKQLQDAQDGRRRSLDQTIASQQLQLKLIGQTVSESERLRMEQQLIAQLEDEAARNHTKADPAEIAAIRQKAAEYGKLAEQIAATNFKREQDETLAGLRTELSLVGASEQTRRRALAALEAEQEIRARGIGLFSAEAQARRQEALQISETNNELRKQTEAWGKVQKAGEDAIDNVVDDLAGGNWKKALEDVGKDIASTALDIGVKAPLKNALLGTDYGTADDIGGLGGIVGKLLGRNNPLAGALDKSVASMSVNAATVMVNGAVSNPTGLLGNLLGDKTANNNLALPSIFKDAGATKTGIPLSMIDAGNGLNAKVAAPYASRFQGLLNDLKAAGYPIKSLGEGGYSFRNVAGTHHLSNHAFGEALDINPRENPQAYGAKGNWADYGIDPNALARQNGLFYGGNWKKADTMHFQVDHSADAASASLTKLSASSDMAGKGLGTLGQTLANSLGGNASPSGGFNWASLFSSSWSPNTTFSSFIGLSGGGFTGDAAEDAVTGFVHGKEFVVKAPVVAKPGVRRFLQALNDDRLGGFRSGGYTSGGTVSDYVPASPAPAITFIDNSRGVSVEHRQESDGRGGRQDVFEISDRIGQATAMKGGGAAKSLKQNFGVRPLGINRG